MILEGRRPLEQKDLRVSFRPAERTAIRDVVQRREERRVIGQANTQLAAGIAQPAVHGDPGTFQRTGGEHDKLSVISARGVAEQILADDLRGLRTVRRDAGYEVAKIDG